MSGEDFIYSAIADDNMNAFDLNVIASTLASTDKLVRQNKQQKEENDRLREKISSLRESALQIKTLYETEQAKASRAEAQLASYVSQCKQLEERCLAADSDKINADLILMEQLAEKERQHEEKERRYQSLITDVIRYFSLPDDATESAKRRELKHHLPTVDTLGLPDEVKSFLLVAPTHRSRRRKRRSASASVWDRECQTSPVRLCDGSSNTDQPYPVRPDVRHCGTDALPGANIPSEQPFSKSFCDKGTMHTTSTITRATCTSVFIKRVDVGVNFPEVTHKSVDEILRECVPLPPLLLSPITEILPICGSIGTQTDAPMGADVDEKPALVTCGTITNLKNIRKRIDYRMSGAGGDGGMAAFQQQYTSVAEQLFAKIKKEDQAAGFGFEADDTFGSMHPHLSTIWKLLGESIFMLMSSGRRFDSQCYNTLNEQLTTIRDMIDADGRRESELMSNMFSNVRATVVAAAGYGKDRGTAAAFRAATAPVPRSECSSSEEDCGVMIVEKDSAESDNQFTTAQSVASQTKEMLSDSTVSASSSPEVVSSGMQTVRSGIESEARPDAESIETNGADTVPKTGHIEEEQISTLTQPSSVVLDDDVDRIEQQLQMMEEGHIEQSSLTTGSDTPATVSSSFAELPITNADSTPSPEACIPVAAPKSPPREPPRASSSPTSPDEAGRYSTTATFVSPIKVKETNQLVQDQFKTPTQPPIGKRKLRLRRSGEVSALHTLVPPPSLKRLRLNEDECSSTGRTSPTTEFLLEDDWDEKFSSMRAAMLGTRWDDAQCSPLSPIADHLEGEEDGDQMEDGDTGEVQQQQTDDRREVVTALLEEVKERPISPEPEAASRIGEEKSEVQDCVIDRIEISKEPEETASDSALEPELHVQRIEPSVATPVLEMSLPLERRLSAEVVAVESVSHHLVPTSPVNTDVPTNKESEENVAEEEHRVPTSESLEDGEISDEDTSMLDCSSTELLVIASDPECVPDAGSSSSSVWDSPLSPPAHETGLSIVIEPMPAPDCNYLPDSPLSPPLPCDRAPTVRSEPPRIPLFHRALHQHLQQQAHDRTEPIFHCIAKYSFKRMQETGQKYPNWTSAANDKQQPVVQQLTETLSGYLKCPDWTETIVNETLAAVLNCTQDMRLISRAVLELVIASGDITFSVLCSPPAPPIPLTQQKLVLIVRHLAYGLVTLDEVLLHELDRRMFQLKQQGPEQLSLTALIALTFLYIGLEDSKPSECPWKRQYSVRLYMFKCMYYFGYKCLPLVYYVLRAFPYALPKKGSPHYDNADAMIATLRTILMNVNYGETGVGSPEVGLYRKRELLWLLRNTYGYQPGSPTYDELIVNLVEKIRANKLRNVAYALILVAKRNGYEWARLHIIQRRIYPLLNDYLKQFELMRATATVAGCGVGAGASSGSGSSSGNTGSSSATASTTELDDRIVACIFTIASIMKTQPSHEDASRVMQIFTTIVQLAEGNRAIQEEAIAGLIKFSRFGYVDVFQRLASWCPDYPISDRIQLMLKTMICRKPPRYWRQLMGNRVV